MQVLGIEIDTIVKANAQYCLFWGSCVGFWVRTAPYSPLSRAGIVASAGHCYCCRNYPLCKALRVGVGADLGYSSVRGPSVLMRMK